MSDNVPSVPLRMRAPAETPTRASRMAQPAINQEANSVGTTEANSDEMSLVLPNFDIRVGRDLVLFRFDYHDLRSESELIRALVPATGLELRSTDPEAFALIHNWFSGHLGVAPIDKSARDLYTAAARIARGLGLTECESQLIVVVRRAEAILADIINDEIVSGVRMDIDAVKEYVAGELDNYLSRSRNVGGEDTDFEDFEPAEIFY